MSRMISIIVLIIMSTHVTFSRNFDNVRIGDYIYNDGSHYRRKLEDSKNSKCIGVVISVTPNAEQLEMGYTHGIIVLLEDIPGLYQWWPQNESVPGVPDASSVPEENAYAYTHKYLAPLSEAAKACVNYPKVGSLFSKCFIPTESMWNLMLENIGLLTAKLMDVNTDIGIDARKTCAARLQYLIGGFKEDRYDYWLAQQFGSYSAYFGHLKGTNNGGYYDSYDGRGRYTLDGNPGYLGNRTHRRRLRAMCYF